MPAAYLPEAVTIDRRVRPLRLAFLVRPSDKDRLRQIFEINTVLWGGKHNAILPIYDDTPEWWTHLSADAPPYEEILRGYIDAFEPDYLVSTEPAWPGGLGFPEDRVLSLDDAVRDDDAQVGLSTFHVLEDLYRDEYRFVARHPERAVLAYSADPAYQDYVAAFFGRFPESPEHLRRAYQDVFDPQETEVTAANLFSIVTDSHIVPLSVTAAYIDVVRRGFRNNEPSIFILNPDEGIDLIDFWNLRALGWRVIPIPTGWAADLAEPAADFATSNHRPYRHNRQLVQQTHLLHSRSGTHETWQSFHETIREKAPGALCLHTWFPRMWDPAMREADHLVRCRLNVEQSPVEADLREDGSVTFQSIDPPFLKDPIYRSTPGWVNVLRIRTGSPMDNTALVFSGKITAPRRLLKASGDEIPWPASEGLIVPKKGTSRTHYLRIPSGIEVLADHLHDSGSEVALSQPGRIAAHLTRNLGGLWRARLLAHKPLLTLLDKMAAGLVESEVTDEDNQRRQRKGQAVPRDRILQALQPSGRERRFKSLIDAGLLQVGAKLACPECNFTNWYRVDTLSARLTCEYCLSEYPFPAGAPPPNPWAYRSAGPASIPHFGHGAFSVCLTLDFLVNGLHGEATWTPSVTVTQSDGSEREADFVLFWRSQLGDGLAERIVVGECKSFNDFTENDFKRASELIDIFSDPLLVFATLRPEISEDAQRRIQSLVDQGANVAVLTGAELLARDHAPLCWTLSEECRLKEAGERFRDDSPLASLCAITQGLHLGGVGE